MYALIPQIKTITSNKADALTDKVNYEIMKILSEDDVVRILDISSPSISYSPVKERGYTLAVIIKYAKKIYIEEDSLDGDLDFSGNLNFDFAEPDSGVQNN